MDRTQAEELRLKVQHRWACRATLVDIVPVEAFFEGQRLQSVDVHVFGLTACARGNRAYAWESRIEDSANSQTFLSLHVGPVNSPQNAVGAAVADDFRTKRLAMRNNPGQTSAGFPVHARLSRIETV